MKNLLFILILISLVGYSAECTKSTSEEVATEKQEIATDVPSHLKGAKIIVRLANGSESEVPAEKFKVVPRKQQFLVTKTLQTNSTSCSTEANKNRVSLLGGYGPKEGISRSSNGSTVSVKSKVGAIGGAQYQRLITERISIGGQLQTNKSVLLNLGLDF